VCALAVYLEDEGIATVVISLLDLHSKKIRPPRALWVPFELGRPFGPPGQPDFQRSVLSAALNLLQHEGPAPVHEDFSDSDPGAEADPGWTAPATQECDDIEQELELLDSAWHKARQRYGNTAVGLSGLPLRDVVAFLKGLDSDRPFELPQYAREDGLSDVLRMRLCADDIRAFYSEAACCDADPSSEQVWSWFWQQTQAGNLLRQIRENSLLSDQKKRQVAGSKFLVPRAFL